MNLYSIDDYKKLFLTWSQRQPKRGRGVLSQLARHLEVHSTLLSLIFKGSSHLTPEQAILTAQFMKLTPLETEYFCMLVQQERVAKASARRYVETRLQELRRESENLRKSLNAQSDLQEADYATFFSHWIYSWMFLQVAVSPGMSKMSLLNLTPVDGQIQEAALQFLLEKGVLLEQDLKLQIGSRQIYVGRESTFLRNHLINWRSKSIEQIRDHNDPEDLYFSSPVAVSHADRKVIAQKIRELLQEFKTVSDPSASEIVCCLNMDWFAVLPAGDS